MAKKKRRKKSRKIKKTRKRSKSRRKKSRKIKKSRRIKKTRKKQNFKTLTHSKDGEGNTVIKVSDSWAHNAYVNASKYTKKYKLSIKDNEKFWAKEGKRISWIKKYLLVLDRSLITNK